MKVALFAGGVGGARMALGFAKVLPGGDFGVIVNVGDDDQFHGLNVCPDIDTVLYTLSGIVDRRQGWGVMDDTTKALSVLRLLGSPGAWMKLGDVDLGLHIYRTAQLSKGMRLTAVTADIARAHGVGCTILPVSDTACPTIVETDSGPSRFQEWFVRDGGAPKVRGLRFDSAKRAAITPEVCSLIKGANLIVFAPSNPYLSIQPILEVRGVKEALGEARVPKVAVSPLIGGRAIKGPLAKVMEDLGAGSSNAGIADFYEGIANALIIDEQDASEAAALRRDHALDVAVFPTLIADSKHSVALAQYLMQLCSAPIGM